MIKKNQFRKIEILSPAGSYQGMLSAVNAGCDAVYIGGLRFGARAYADNLKEEELLRAIDYMHLKERKLYLTVNTLLKDLEMEGLFEYLSPFYKNGLDGVIVQDMGAVKRISEQFPLLPIHASTQMTLTDSPGINQLKQWGVKRAVLSRELSLTEIEAIRRETDLELEAFVHGALCVCYSGQCLMSSLIGQRSGNRGRCAQPCRQPYTLWDGKHCLSDPGEAYLLSPRDMCTLEILPKLIEAGIDSFKIEGRMKNAGYASYTALMYRRYTDLYLELGGEGYQEYLSAHETQYQEDIRGLKSLYARGSSTTGYYQQYSGRDMMSLDSSAYRTKEAGTLIHWQEPCEKKEGLTARFVGIAGKEMLLELGNARSRVAVKGGLVEKAENRPITGDKIEEQLKKTGNTPFIIEALEMEAAPDIFIPIGKLNELRRDALEAFTASLLSGFRREEAMRIEERPAEQTQKNRRHKPLFLVSVTRMEQLKAALAFPEVEAVYLNTAGFAGQELEGAVELVLRENKEVFLMLPAVLRRKDREKSEWMWEGALREKVSGYLIKNQEELSLLAAAFRKQAGGEKQTELILDYNMYAYQKEAREAYRQMGADRFTAPAELNFKELKRLDLSGSDMIIYGYQALMTTVQCMGAETGGCKREGRALALKDRLKKPFYVIPFCQYCYNSIYNGQALSLLGYEKEIRALSPYGLRLDFTIEDRKEAGRVLHEYIRRFCCQDGGSGKDRENTTRGHLKRGVE